MVEYVNIKKQNALIKAELVAAFESCLESSDFILGSEVTRLEANICELLHVKYAVGVNSGTDALILSLKALGIGSGDEVITVSNSFVATASSIVMCGATPLFVDIDEMQQMDVTQIESKITSKTKAIIPVHLMGIPANIAAINELAQKHGLKVVEDAAQAIGAKFDDKYIGSFGDAGCFSFHPLKNLGACGDGGLIVTNNENVYKELLLLRNLGLKDRDNCVVASANSRLDNIQASLLNVKLGYLQEITAKKRAIAQRYFERLEGVKGIKLPLSYEKSFSVYHTFVVRVDATQRADFINYLHEKGVQTKIHYPKAIHQQEAFRVQAKESYLPKTEQIVQEIVSLPIDYTLEMDDIEFTCNVIKAFFGEQ